MKLSDLRIGYAMCGSYCTFEESLAALEALVKGGAQVTPIMSERAASTDTRFGAAADFVARMETLCGRAVIRDILNAEPIGPKKPFDVLVVAPCTGNTLGKLAHGVADSSVTLAVKAHLRNERPVVLCVSSNDALAGNAASIGTLLARRHMFFVPMRQDDPEKKPRSIVADFKRIPETVLAAAEGRQIQPIIMT